MVGLRGRAGLCLLLLDPLHQPPCSPPRGGGPLEETKQRDREVDTPQGTKELLYCGKRMEGCFS